MWKSRLLPKIRNRDNLANILANVQGVDMVDGLIGIKVGMTQVQDAEGIVTPVTVIRTGPCVVVQRKTEPQDGYAAVQLGLVEARAARRAAQCKPLAGHFKKAGVPPTRKLSEFQMLEGTEVKVGDHVRVENVFQIQDKVDVTGISKGKGYAGVVKRHHFGGGAATHGSMFHRAPGSIGGSSYPSRVFKGMKAAGRMGGEKVTVKNLRVMSVHPEENLLLVSGCIPGCNGSYVTVRKIIR